MGVLAGFGSGNVVLIRQGTAVDLDPDSSEPKMFRALVNSAGYEESWVEGLNVFHNPDAAVKFDSDLIPGAGHHYCSSDGQMVSSVPAFHPYGSITQHIAPVDVAEFVAQVGDKSHMMWASRRIVTDEENPRNAG
jgi:hypothetical protein